MAEERSLRRRVLAEAVQENLDTIQGVRRVRRRRAAPLAGVVAAVAIAVAAAAGLAAWLGDGRRVRREPTVAAESAPARTVGRTLSALPGSVDALPLLAPVAPIDASVFRLAASKVVLDPGHGGPNTGAVSPRGVRGARRLREKDVALEVARRLQRLLTSGGFEVVMTRDADIDVPLRERAAFANDAGGDLFVSIHLNWIEGRRGVETYSLGTTADPELNLLAATENRGSGYSQADMRRLLEDVYTGWRRAESQSLAAAIQTELYGSLAAVNPGLRDRGVKTAPFLVLVDTRMPAVLAEVSCLSDAREVALLEDPLYLERIAAALARGVRRYAGDDASVPDLASGAR
jgi:N-acetylmuramoyl-L-alanine amidase